MKTPTRWAPWMLPVALAAAGCEDKPSAPLAPTASALAPAHKPAMSQTFTVQAEGSKVTFLMDAPLEKIHGEAPDSAAGNLHLNLSDLKQSTGLVKIDLDKLALHQQKRENEKSDYGERQKNAKQNEHARAWLEIGPDAPAEVREKNRWVELRIEKIVDVQPQADVGRLGGAERKITATVVGDLRLHGRVSKKRAQVEATFAYDGNEPRSVTIRTTQPVAVGLEEHDVRPREAFGKLAQKTLGALGNKVASEAPVQLELTAKAK